MLIQDKGTLQAVSTCGRPWAETRAQMALQLIEGMESGQLSDSEFSALMLDLIKTDELEAEADDMEIKNMLVSAIMFGSRLA